MMANPVDRGIRCQKRRRDTVDYPGDLGEQCTAVKAIRSAGCRATQELGGPGGLGGSLPATRIGAWLQ